MFSEEDIKRSEPFKWDHNKDVNDNMKLLRGLEGTPRFEATRQHELQRNDLNLTVNDPTVNSEIHGRPLLIARPPKDDTDPTVTKLSARLIRRLQGIWQTEFPYHEMIRQRSHRSMAQMNRHGQDNDSVSSSVTDWAETTSSKQDSNKKTGANVGFVANVQGGKQNLNTKYMGSATVAAQNAKDKSEAKRVGDIKRQLADQAQEMARYLALQNFGKEFQLIATNIANLNQELAERQPSAGTSKLDESGEATSSSSDSVIILESAGAGVRSKQRKRTQKNKAQIEGKAFTPRTSPSNTTNPSRSKFPVIHVPDHGIGYDRYQDIPLTEKMNRLEYDDNLVYGEVKCMDSTKPEGWYVTHPVSRQIIGFRQENDNDAEWYIDDDGYPIYDKDGNRRTDLDDEQVDDGSTAVRNNIIDADDGPQSADCVDKDLYEVARLAYLIKRQQPIPTTLQGNALTLIETVKEDATS